MTEILFPVCIRKHPDGRCELVDLREEARHAAIDGARGYEYAIAALRAEKHGGKPEDYVSWVPPGGR